MVHIEFTKDKSDCHIVLDVQPCIGGTSLIISRTELSLPMGDISEKGFADVVARLDFYKSESIDALIGRLQVAKEMLLNAN